MRSFFSQLALPCPGGNEKRMTNAASLRRAETASFIFRYNPCDSCCTGIRGNRLDRSGRNRHRNRATGGLSASTEVDGKRVIEHYHHEESHALFALCRSHLVGA